MKIETTSFGNGGPIPPEFAFCDVSREDHVKLAPNKNPQLSWSGAPDGTKSFVLIAHDPDVPSQGHDVNKEDREVPADIKRMDFFHWVLVDIPASRTEIAAGEFSDGVTARGKGGPDVADDMRQGINSYTDWFAGDEQMEGDYYGYDGPCPPWNDSIVHHYHFTLYALDVERCPVEGLFTGEDVRAAIDGHILGQASVMGIYTLNPSLR